MSLNGSPDSKVSLGQHRVGINFNPSGNPQVDGFKQHAAAAIDELELLKGDDREKDRCAAIAQTKFEEAAMWAVKAATKPAMPQE